MHENAGKCCNFDANILKLFQLESMKYAIIQDNHLRIPLGYLGFK